MDEERKNLTKEHRGRMRDRIERLGIASLSDLEVLEFLLFYGIPYKDTQIIAKRLMVKFGSLTDVFIAPVEELVSVPDMTLNAALLLHTLPDVLFLFEGKRLIGQKVLSTDLLIPYIRFMSPLDRESLCIICLDKDENFLSSKVVCLGTTNRISVEVKRIINYVKTSNAQKVIIAHNHPSNDVTPSADDVHATKDLQGALAQIHVGIKDHLIVGAYRAYSMAQGGIIIDR